MKIKTIVFGNSREEEAFPRLESVLTDSVSAVTGCVEELPSVYDSVQAGLPEIAASLRENDILMIFADKQLYHEAKRSICKAFKFEMLHSEPVLEKLSAMPNSERYMLHALMPKNATPFVLSDGLFPGFAIRSRTQCIFFLPFTTDRTFITMKKFVFPYIQRFYGRLLPNFNEFETSYAANVLENQFEFTDRQIAIANTSLCKYIAHAGKKIESFNDHVSFAPYDRQKAAKEPIQVTAVNAAAYYECQFGAVMADEGKDASGHYTVTIAISNGRTVKIRTIASTDDETREDFMNVAVTEFFLMLANELAQAPEMTKEELKSLKPSAPVHGIHLLIYIFLFAAVFFLTYVAASFSTSSLFA